MTLRLNSETGNYQNEDGSVIISGHDMSVEFLDLVEELEESGHDYGEACKMAIVFLSDEKEWPVK